MNELQYSITALNAVLRSDFLSFVHKVFQTLHPNKEYQDNWHIAAIAHHLMLCGSGQIKRLIVNIPPRSLKSIIISVAYPAWALGHQPDAQIIVVSHTQSLTTALTNAFRSVVESDWYQQAFPAMRTVPRKNTETEYVTTQNGYRVAFSVGGPITGRGADTIILDDPQQADEVFSEAHREKMVQFVRNSLITRLNDKRTGVIILVQQRLHPDDLSGFLLRSHNDWELLRFPAIANEDQSIPIGPGRSHDRRKDDVLHPEREPLDVLKQIQATMGSEPFEAQYQQAPVPAGGKMIDLNWFRTYSDRPQRRRSDRIVQSWDTARGVGPNNDCSACTTWLVRDRYYYLLDVHVLKLSPLELEMRIQALASQHQPYAILIEKEPGSERMIETLQCKCPYTILPRVSTLRKVLRLRNVTPIIQTGQVYLPAEAPFLAGFKTELANFPDPRQHDDQVDSFTQFLDWAQEELIREHNGKRQIEELKAYLDYAQGSPGSKIYRYCEQWAEPRKRSGYFDFF